MFIIVKITYLPYVKMGEVSRTRETFSPKSISHLELNTVQLLYNCGKEAQEY